METIIGIANGSAYVIASEPQDTIIIHDYDVPDDFDSPKMIDADGDAFQRIILQGETIKGKYVDQIDVMDEDSGMKVPVIMIKLENGLMIGIDAALVESDEAMFSPSDGVEIDYSEEDALLKKE